MVINNPDIQSLCKYNKGDWFWNGEKPYLYCKSGLGSSNPHDYKWLPTLEDLFGIWSYLCQTNNSAHPEYLAGTHLPSKFIERINEEMVFRFGYFDKEFCLKIIMEDFYNKSWNGKGWEVIN
jgi:hypothetical protein